MAYGADADASAPFEVKKMKGKIHSYESFGAVDGPGIRFVVFFQGCPMRCAYCHNPDTWDMGKAAIEAEPKEIISKIKRNISFYKTGGITATGGEPLMQLEFLTELFKLAKKNKIHTCLDTSGILFDESKTDDFDKLIKYTDLVMLDIKHIDDDSHKKITMHSNKNVLSFARYLDRNKIPVWIRHVLVPTVTSNGEQLTKLKEFTDTLSNVEKVEFLPYHSMARAKYKELGMDYPLEGIPQADKSHVVYAKKIFGIE